MQDSRKASRFFAQLAERRLLSPEPEPGWPRCRLCQAAIPPQALRLGLAVWMPAGPLCESCRRRARAQAKTKTADRRAGGKR